MANRWEKEDRLVWKRSEVMQELEKKVLDNMRRVEEMAQKAAMNKSATFDETSRNWTPQQWGEFHKSKESPLDDAGLIDDELEDSDDLEDGSSDLDDGHAITQEAMIDELREMAQAAISKGNIKVAYQIERTIKEILEDEF